MIGECEIIWQKYYNDSHQTTIIILDKQRGDIYRVVLDRISKRATGFIAERPLWVDKKEGE